MSGRLGIDAPGQDADDAATQVKLATSNERGSANEHAARLDSLGPILRTVTWHLIPIFFLLNLLNYVDRTNLAFASIQMSRDLNLTQTEYGTGSGLFFIGYSLFQIPSQIFLRALGAPIWLSIIVSVWGAIASAMAALNGRNAFYAARLLLGIAEAGTFPGVWYYLTQFYPDKHITVPYSITDSAIMVAQVVGAPLAAAVLHLDGHLGLAGWRWLFLLEGIPTLLLGAAFPFLLPRSPATARFLGDDERAKLDAHVAMCRGNSHDLAAQSVAWMLRSALANGRMYILGVVKFAKDLAAYGLLFWAPVLIRGLLRRHTAGEDGCEAWEHESSGRRATGYVEVLLTGIPYTLAATMNIVFGWHSQRTHDRRWHVFAGYIAAGTLCLALPSVSALGIVPGFIVFSAVITTALAPNGCLLALASAHARGPAMPVNLALFNSVGNIAGFFGSILLGYVADATCSYDGAFYVMGVALMLGGALVLTVADVPHGLDAGAREIELTAVPIGRASAAADLQIKPWLRAEAPFEIPDEL